MSAVSSLEAGVDGSRAKVSAPAQVGSSRPALPQVALMPGQVVVLIAAVGFGVSIGRVGIDLATVARVIGHHLAAFAVPSHFSALDIRSSGTLRMPRVLLAAVVGAGLSVVGVTLRAAPG